MIKFYTKKVKIILKVNFTFGVFSLVLVSSGCGKSVDVGPPSSGTVGQPGSSVQSGSLPSSTGGGSSGSQPPTSGSQPPGVGGGSGGPVIASCGSGQLLQWTFEQPSSQTNNSLDFLFVMDTSESMDDKRERIANLVPGFISQLSSSLDYRMAVMLGAAGTSPYAGRLYAAKGSSLVLNSKTQTVTDIQTQLKNDLRVALSEEYKRSGEALMYSVLKSLKPKHLKDIQNAGFYRTDAGLAIVFIGDRNDLCYPPELNGYNHFPDYVPSSCDSGGDGGYQNYCNVAGETPSNMPNILLSYLKGLKGAQNLALAGIIHIDPTQVKQGDGDSIGHGILELLKLLPNSIYIDMMKDSYSSDLLQLASAGTASLSLLNQFELSGTVSIQPNTVVVAVDGNGVSDTFDSSTRTVTIPSSAAGHWGSVIHVTACQG